MTAISFETAVWAQLNHLLLWLAIPLVLGGCATGTAESPAPGPSPEKTVTAAASIPVLPAATATPASSTPSPTPTPGLAELLLAGARHWQGNPQAPVTFIELSDFK